jgi:hypothetical protein
MSYKKLNEDELRVLHRNLKGYFEKEQHADIVKLVSKYYAEPFSVLVTVSSEYNDEDYDNCVESITVYDAQDIEIPLSKKNKTEFLEEARDIQVVENTPEQLEDFVVYISSKLPEVYVKEQ